MDAGNGMAGVVVEKTLKGINLDIDKMYFEPDGTFPNHEANPLIEENRLDIMARVKDTDVDLGIAWDADCDRVYFIDENGKYINGDFITALLAVYFLEKEPSSGIVYDLRCSKVVRDLVEKNGGIAHMERVGHSYIKKTMRETNSIFGGEVSGHFYFSQNSFMDNGFIPALIILEMVSKSGKKISELIKELGDYYVSGEINFTVDAADKVIERIRENYEGKGEKITIDGLKFDFKNWSFGVRPSANDPVLRLNLEAGSQEMVEEKVKEVSELIKG